MVQIGVCRLTSTWSLTSLLARTGPLTRSAAAAYSLGFLSCPVVRATSGKVRARERRCRRVSLGDVTAHGRVQDWPSRERLGTRLQLLYFTITDDGCTFFGPLTYNHMSSCACVVSVAHLLSLDAYCIFSCALHQLYISIKDIASRENEQFSLLIA